jgi:hypothetical protein
LEFQLRLSSASLLISLSFDPSRRDQVVTVTLGLFQERTMDETKIREEILSLIAQHVKAVNHIYSNTLFDGKESYKNIRFEVQRIKVKSPQKD